MEMSDVVVVSQSRPCIGTSGSHGFCFAMFGCHCSHDSQLSICCPPCAMVPAKLADISFVPTAKGAGPSPEACAWVLNPEIDISSSGGGESRKDSDIDLFESSSNPKSASMFSFSAASAYF